MERGRRTEGEWWRVAFNELEWGQVVGEKSSGGAPLLHNENTLHGGGDDEPPPSPPSPPSRPLVYNRNVLLHRVMAEKELLE